ncbi:MAG: hypothetical protein AABY49_06180, partial [Planctomycetota bacterium]
MRTFNFNLTFVIIFISFYCSVAIGSSPLGYEHSAPFQNSEPIPGVVKNEPILLEDEGHEEVPEEIHIEEVKEYLVTETVLSDPITETIKEEKDLKPAWNIWHKDPTHNVLLAVAIIL